MSSVVPEGWRFDRFETGLTDSLDSDELQTSEEFHHGESIQGYIMISCLSHAI